MSSLLGLGVWTTAIGFPTENGEWDKASAVNSKQAGVWSSQSQHCVHHTNCVDGLSVGNQTKAVLENSTSVEQR